MVSLTAIGRSLPTFSNAVCKIGPWFLYVREALNKPDFVMTLRYSQKISPYISCICCVDIFCSRLVSSRTRTYSELPKVIRKQKIQRFSAGRRSIQSTILNRFADIGAGDVVCAGEIGNRPR